MSLVGLSIMKEAVNKEQLQFSDQDWQSGLLTKHPQVKELLMQRAKTGEPMLGFSLANGDLSDINIVNRASKVG